MAASGISSPQTWPSFAAYLVSFFVIGVIWVNHHALFTLIDRVDRVLLFENLALLMFVTTLPFTTSTLAKFVREVAPTHAGQYCSTASPTSEWHSASQQC